MSYNKAKAEKEWLQWKEAEEKKLRELGVDEDTIQRLHTYDWVQFNKERRFLQRWDTWSPYVDQISAQKLVLSEENEEHLLDSIENEKLLYTENGIDKEYVLEFCGAGEWTIRNYQDKALFPRAQIVFASDGVKMFFTKIHPATIVECVYTESPDRSSDTLYLKLRNFEPNFVGEDDSFFGYDYDRIEVILRYGSFTISYMSDMITLSDYTEYTFTFDFTDRLPPTISSIDVILHKDGNIASDPVSHKL